MTNLLRLSWCYLHSTMFLLNRGSSVSVPIKTYTFTFHYVSIKSQDIGAKQTFYDKFTFHYVSIKSAKMLHLQKHRYDLHSTMFLLNLSSKWICAIYITYLHSTMFLLNRVRPFCITQTVRVFTFHYVSIKSTSTAKGVIHFRQFTFHYVSIKLKKNWARSQKISIYIPLCFY